MYFYENAQKELFFFSFQTLAISQNIQAEFGLDCFSFQHQPIDLKEFEFLQA
jgi:hypothetical protein